MIDLHLHLDGSLSEDDYRVLAHLNGVTLGDDFPACIHVDPNCSNLNEYLTKFDLPLKLLQNEFSIAYAAKSLVKRLASMGFIYAEIRFAPQLHTKKGMSQNNAVVAALSGLKSGIAEYPDFDANLILCCMRQASKITNMETIKVADKFRNDKVVAVDLAGPEDAHPGEYYIPLFEEARKKKLNVIIHAGEACGSEEVICAINKLHANRIGHGIHLDINKNTVDMLSKKRITFEFCPTSNIQTKSIPDYKHLPISDFLKYGIPVTINSDNMAVSDTNVYKEFKHLIRELGVRDFEIKFLLYNAINAAFVSEPEKIKLRNLLDKKFSECMHNIAIQK